MKAKKIQTTFESESANFRTTVSKGDVSVIFRYGKDARQGGWYVPVQTYCLRELGKFALELADYIEQEGKDE